MRNLAPRRTRLTLAAILPLAVATLPSTLAAVPAMATEDGLQAPDPVFPYRVTGVAAGDVLNLRMWAGPDGEIVGTLAPDAADVVLTGESSEFEGTVWWGVAMEGGKTGWANARYLSRIEDPVEPGPFPMACGGTEPFWGVTVRDGKAEFTSPETEPGSVTYAAEAWTIASARLYERATRLTAAEGTGFLAVQMVDSYCSDGMSESSYPYDGLLMTPAGTLYEGCCHRIR